MVFLGIDCILHELQPLFSFVLDLRVLGQYGISWRSYPGRWKIRDSSTLEGRHSAPVNLKIWRLILGGGARIGILVCRLMYSYSLLKSDGHECILN